jgi:hypothetical protein
MTMADGSSSPNPDFAERSSKADWSITALLADLVNEATRLIQQEAALFRAELSEKLGYLGRGVTAFGAGALVAFSGWLVLLAAAVLGLATTMAAWLAALIVGVVVSTIGAVLLFVGKRRMDLDTLMPERTLRSLREDGAWIREQLR